MKPHPYCNELWLTFDWNNVPKKVKQKIQHPLVVSLHGGSISSSRPFGRCWVFSGPGSCRGWKVVRIMIYEVWYVIFVHCIFILLLMLLRMYCILNEYYFGATILVYLHYALSTNLLMHTYLYLNSYTDIWMYNHEQQAMIKINFQWAVIMICIDSDLFFDLLWLLLVFDGPQWISWQMFLFQLKWTSETAVFGLMRFTVTILWTCFKTVLKWFDIVLLSFHGDVDCLRG